VSGRPFNNRWQQQQQQQQRQSNQISGKIVFTQPRIDLRSGITFHSYIFPHFPSGSASVNVGSRHIFPDRILVILNSLVRKSRVPLAASHH
jgi:hypothetical protein